MRIQHVIAHRLRTKLLGGVAALAMAGVLGGAFLLVHADAQAASASVSTGNPTNRFTSNVANINVGDHVTFTWAAGTHIVDLKDVSPDLPIDSAHTSGTTTAFTTPGTYYYYCSVHATADLATEAHVQANDAMVGKIVVTAASGGGASPTTAGSATNAPAAPATGTGVTGSGAGLPWLPITLIVGSVVVLAGSAAFAVERRR